MAEPGLPCVRDTGEEPIMHEETRRPSAFVNGEVCKGPGVPWWEHHKQKGNKDLHSDVGIGRWLGSILFRVLLLEQ